MDCRAEVKQLLPDGNFDHLVGGQTRAALHYPDLELMPHTCGGIELKGLWKKHLSNVG
jgi:hypothetical protein